ncbi:MULTISPECIES: TetR/AcrR family transcriptional regulator [unclassified Streptomyces]|uniref:TetR/AcrR family transcriptional regulator n=1 Tax=unclassified Streptomyces TaxID=2593676 RepID=UPI00224CBAF4|nr:MULTISPECIES: TetR/AcrR family transcriptional regulator [unclassified Streptomyces]MCX4525252.1 TetR/AcrR family transcriptional regulator [Streptomyces sp. NBC_01551]MCX4544236.1 TetR/AcrR family transcriptional regulator [Streptomyces sp. NBC_01565]
MLTPKSRRATPERLLDAAETLMRTSGLANATTKAIAREAGCSEAALYKYFTNKEELFVRVLMERRPNAGALMSVLTEDPAERTVEEVLTDIARHASLFYADAMPMAASLFADPALLTRHRDGVRTIGAGPHIVLDALSGHLLRERERGRLRPDADPRAAASLLLGACFQRAFFLHFSGADVVQPVEEFAPAVARTTWAALR